MRDVFFGWGGGYFGQELENAWYMDNGIYDFNNFQPSINSPILSFLADKIPPATGAAAQALAGVIADWIIPKY
jgi:hypothetical protein